MSSEKETVEEIPKQYLEILTAAARTSEEELTRKIRRYADANNITIRKLAVRVDIYMGIGVYTYDIDALDTKTGNNFRKFLSDLLEIKPDVFRKIPDIYG